MALKLAVFDVDGTLVDSREHIHRAACESFAELGLPEPAYDQVRQIVGLTLHEALATMSPHLGEADHVRLTAGFQRAFQRFQAEPGFHEPLYDGAADLLDRLKSDGWLIAMATGKPRRGVDNIVRMHGWADLFDSTHCSDDGPGKPHPAMLQAAMRALGCSPERTVMIGDTAWDMRMARAANVRAQAVAWGFHTVEELTPEADHVAETFAELEEQLDGFAANLHERA